MLRYDKDKLRESLSNEDIIKLLHELGSENIIDESDSKGQIISNTICHNHSGGDMKLYYFTESKSFHCFTQCSCNFDVYDLVIRNYKSKGIELPFSAAVEWVAQKSGNSFGFGFGFTEPKEKETSSELAWMNRFNKKSVELIEPPVFSNKILDVFSKNVYHHLFTEDYITPDAMDKFETNMYYNRDERIVIPYRNIKGELIGLKGRATRKEDEERGYKYLPLTIQKVSYRFPNYSQIYGLYYNQNTIRRLKKVIIFESEKSVMQCESYFPDNNFSVALSGRNLSQNQINMLLNLGIEEVQLAFDKEFKEENTLEEQRNIDLLLKIGRRLAPYVRVYTLFDRYNLLGYKDSPSDKGKETLMELMSLKEEIFNIED